MTIFNLPDLGEGLAEAEIREWYIKEGDEVKVDQPLVAMETAKALVDVPSPYAGKILKLHGKPNDIIQTGAPLITYVTNDQAPTRDKGSVVGSLQESEQTWQEEKMQIGGVGRATQIKAMPAARVLANQMQVDLNKISPTGPQGLITVDDVKAALRSHPSLSSASTQPEALHGVRRAMAIAMAQAHQEVVAATVVEDVDVTDLPSQTDITVHILNAIVAATQTEPALNAWFNGKTLERQLFSEVNIGVAVDTPEGLLVPVIKDVGAQTDAQLREKINHYKNTAAKRAIPAADLQGATITLSNFGTIMGRYGTPIVMPPTVAIIGCGRTRETAIVKGGALAIGRMMPLSLTFDHRAITGGEATRFLGALIQALQKVN